MGWIGGPMGTKLIENDKRYQRKDDSDSINPVWGKERY
jgi:hypothetical protein